ncbi:MAG TPA: restriction endonuclease subunit S [Panacibacter sp.]|nr:restriction endonuclease subunit S [Panacibacter sp.]
MTTTKKIPALRFPEFEGEWEENYLGQIFTFKNGVNAEKAKYGQGIKFINVLDIINNNFITYDNIIGVVEVSESEFEKNEVKYGDILFQRSSETREEVGQANVYLGDKSVTFGGFVIRGRGVQDYDPAFMNYLLKTTKARKEITDKSGGSTRYNVGQETLKEVKIYLSCLEEQKKIGSFLNSIDNKIQQLTKKKALLEQYKKGLMQQIFNRQIRFKDDNGNDYPDWEELSVQNLIDGNEITSHLDGNHGALYPKSSEFVKEGVPYVTANDFISGEVDLKNCKYLSIEHANKFKKGVAKDGDVLFAHNATVGPTALLKTTFDFVILSTTATYFRCDNKNLFNSYFKHYLRSSFFEKQYVQVMSQSTRNQVPITTQRKFKIKLPIFSEQQKIASFLTSIDNKINTVNKQLEQTQEYKKGLLQQMFV